MPTKLFFLLFGTLLLAQCVFSNSSEESSNDNSKDSSEEKITENHLTRHVGILYTKVLDETTASVRESFEPIINEVETNKVTTNTNLQKKLTELKAALEKTNTKTTTTENEEKRNRSHVRQEICQILQDLKKIEDELTTPTEQDLKVRRAFETVTENTTKAAGTFADRTIQEIEKYWKGLTTTEQKEKQKLHDVLVEAKTESSTLKKLEILEKMFEFNEDTVTNTITS